METIWTRVSRSRTLWGALIAAGAFAAGNRTAEIITPAHAAENITPMVIDLMELKSDDISKPSERGFRTRPWGQADTGTVGTQEGPSAKHFHNKSHEVFYVVSGTGTTWLGDKQVQLKPGLLVIAPIGTHHGGTVGSARLLTFKTPPQVPGDVVNVQ